MQFRYDQDEVRPLESRDQPEALTLIAFDQLHSEQMEVTCLGCGESFVGAFYDDCPTCGAPADGA